MMTDQERITALTEQVESNSLQVEQLSEDVRKLTYALQDRLADPAWIEGS